MSKGTLVLLALIVGLLAYVVISASPVPSRIEDMQPAYWGQK